MIGKTLADRYRLIRLLGRGGMGSVYEAEDITNGQMVALKTITLVGDKNRVETQVGRFRREVRAAMAIEDEHIVPVLDHGVDVPTGTPFLVMEILVGEDLQSLLERVEKLRPDPAIRIAAQACEGIRRAHEVGIVHRDIKPANLFMVRESSGRIIVKVLDFGIAKVTPQRVLAEAASTTGLTRTGSMLGSPQYMAPEQARGLKEVDHRADIWSLGVVLYRALCGITPHGDIDALGELIISICHDAPRSIQERAPWIEPEVSAVVHGALRIDPQERYPDAASMLEALRSLLPNGSDLHEDMLVPIPDAERVNVARRFDKTTIEEDEEPSKHVIQVPGSREPISGHEATIYDAPPDQPPSSDQVPTVAIQNFVAPPVIIRDQPPPAVAPIVAQSTVPTQRPPAPSSAREAPLSNRPPAPPRGISRELLILGVVLVATVLGVVVYLLTYHP